MTTSESHAETGFRPEIPESAWALGWLFLGEQILRLFVEGVGENNVIPVSAALSALIVTWFSYGVLTGKSTRIAIVWFLMGFATLGQSFLLLNEPSIWHAVLLFATLGQLCAFLAFRHTAFYAWQRTRPRNASEGLGALLAIAVAVGVLGGIIGTNGGGVGLHLNV